jgi:lipoprotein NlpD
VTRPPAPVSEGASNRIEPARPGKPAAKADAAKAVAPVAGTEVKPITGGGPVVARSLDDKPVAVAPASTPAPPPSLNTETLKREPKGGKLPYSPEALAQFKARDGQAAPSAAPDKDKPVVAVPAAPSPPPAAPAVAALDWAWPVPGKPLSGFNEGGAGQEANKGLDIAGKIGDPVLSAAAGKVIFVGTMAKYGNLVIVLHSGGYSSVYAHNSRILVKEGQAVTRGQKIAELGNTDADQPKLHFEIRQQGKPTDPLRFLPPR